MTRLEGVCVRVPDERAGAHSSYGRIGVQRMLSVFALTCCWSLSQPVQVPRRTEARMEVQPLSPYRGQQVLVDYKILTNGQVYGTDLVEQPDFAGFWIETIQLPQEAEPVRRLVDGKISYEFTVKRVVIYPLAAGTIVLAPATFAISLPPPPSDPLKSSQVVHVKTSAFRLAVREWPASGVPPSFQGDVGAYALDAQWHETDGPVLSLRVTVRGRGNVKNLRPPPFPPGPNWDALPPRHLRAIFSLVADSPAMLQRNVYGGEASWEYRILPRAGGELRLPPLPFAFFDPWRGRYQELSVPLGIVRAPEREVAREARLERAAGASVKERDGFPRWISAAVFVAAAGVGILLFRRRRRPPVHPMGQRPLRCLREAEAIIDNRSSRKFYDLVLEAASAFQDQRLSAGQAMLDEERERLASLMNLCEVARFAPADPHFPQRRQILMDARSLVESWRP